jgi:hypothetical protein
LKRSDRAVARERLCKYAHARQWLDGRQSDGRTRHVRKNRRDAESGVSVRSVPKLYIVDLLPLAERESLLMAAILRDRKPRNRGISTVGSRYKQHSEAT